MDYGYPLGRDPHDKDYGYASGIPIIKIMVYWGLFLGQELATLAVARHRRKAKDGLQESFLPPFRWATRFKV